MLLDHEVVVEGELIAAVRPSQQPPTVPLLAPGFIDLQVNGHGAIDVATAESPAAWAEIEGTLLSQGVTSWCPTLIGAPRSVLEERVARIARHAESAPGSARPEVLGVHLEGPYLGAAHGAHSHVEPGPVDGDWLVGLGEAVRLVTLGPECGGAVGAIAQLVESGVTVALGHTEASYEQTVAAIDAGASLFTHLYNASGEMHHRTPGAVGAALSDDRIAVSLIGDGHHVHPAMLQTAWRSKPADKVVLVTDATAWQAKRLADVGVALIDGAPRLADGTLAGSALSMDAAIRFSTTSVGADPVDAIRAATVNPATVLGLTDRGVIAPGRRADLVALDDARHPTHTWVGGVQAWSAGDYEGASGS